MTMENVNSAGKSLNLPNLRNLTAFVGLVIKKNVIGNLWKESIQMSKYGSIKENKDSYPDIMMTTEEARRSDKAYKLFMKKRGFKKRYIKWEIKDENL